MVSLPYHHMYRPFRHLLKLSFDHVRRYVSLGVANKRRRIPLFQLKLAHGILSMQAIVYKYLFGHHHCLAAVIYRIGDSFQYPLHRYVISFNYSALVVPSSRAWLKYYRPFISYFLDGNSIQLIIRRYHFWHSITVEPEYVWIVDYIIRSPLIYQPQLRVARTHVSQV